MKRISFFAGAIVALAFASAAVASPVPYVNAPFSTPQELANTVISNVNTALAPAASLVTCSGTTTSTCTGTRIQVSVTGLVTAAGVTSAAMVVTDTSVLANSTVFCQSNGYAGTGNPNAVNVVPAAGTLTFNIQNSHASAALNATVPVSCLIQN